MVRELEGGMARVAVRRHGSCDGCAAGTACRGEGDTGLIEAFNEADARPGDMVRVSFRPYTYLKGSLLLFGVPALALIAGAVAGKRMLSGVFPATDPNLVAAGAGFGLCIAALIAVRLAARRLEKKTELMPVITEIIKTC